MTNPDRQEWAGPSWQALQEHYATKADAAHMETSIAQLETRVTAEIGKLGTSLEHLNGAIGWKLARFLGGSLVGGMAVVAAIFKFVD